MRNPFWWSRKFTSLGISSCAGNNSGRVYCAPMLPSACAFYNCITLMIAVHARFTIQLRKT